MDSLNDNYPQAVFFDWDGTLVDTLSWLLSAHNHVRAELGYAPWDENEFKGHVRYSSRELYGSLYGDDKDKALDILSSYMSKNHLESLTILPDAYELLVYLKGQGMPVGIVSNKRHPFLLKEIEHLGWNHLVDVAIGAGYGKKDKPDPEPLLTALEACSLDVPASVWYVGDSETDMITAGLAGCKAILVRHHHDNEALINKYNPHAVFDNCTALKDSLDKAA